MSELGFPRQGAIGAFLRQPLFSTAFSLGFGTLYTAVYRLRLGQMELRWPKGAWTIDIAGAVDGEMVIHIPDEGPRVLLS